MDNSLNRYGLFLHLKICPQKKQKEVMEFAIKVNRKFFSSQWNDSNNSLQLLVIYKSVLVTSDTIASWLTIQELLK